jgi:uncharacterized membrane protein YccC
VDSAAPSPGTIPETSAAAPRGAADRARVWLARKDPGLRATKRSVRAAVVVPVVLAIAVQAADNTQTPLFAVFGSMSLLVFSDFGGSRRQRARAYAWLWVTGAVFITVGTLCSSSTVAAVLGMGLAAFAVLFAGIISPQAAAASTAVLLTFVLPVSERAGASAVGDRLVGWVLAGALCIPTALFVWAGRWHDPLRRALAAAARALADLTADAAASGGCCTDREPADRALRALRAQYEATPYRPTGAGPTDVALTNLVARLEWVGSRARAATARIPPAAERARVEEVEAAASEVLDAVADLLDAGDPRAHPDGTDRLHGAVDRMVAARDAGTESVIGALVAGVVAPGGSTVDAGTDPADALGRIDPTFPVRMMAFALEMLAEVVFDAVGHRGADPGPVARWWEATRSMARMALGHLTPRSVWFRNSVRGAVALALAVLVVEQTTVQHGFWVVLGTLSVLRSNALGTGSSAVRAVLGTAIGFLVGYLVLLAVGHHGAVLWYLLPVAVLVAAISPTTISFTGGQAGFTVFVVLVFNIIDPVGYRIGLVRFEDVLIGVSVSIVVGLLFWPRGAGAELARALGHAYATSAAWLTAAVDRVGRPPEPDGAAWGAERIAAMGAARRLDDAYRQYLGERGEKSVPLPTVTRLLTGTARIRLTAVTLEGLPDLTTPGGPPPLPEVVTARSLVAGECAVVETWFDRFATTLGRRSGTVPPVPDVDARLAPELLAAWSAVQREGRRPGVIAVLRLLWVEQRMADLRRLQGELADTAASVAG